MKLKKLSLSMEGSELNSKETNDLLGGDHTIVLQRGVRCACKYASQGGASTNANRAANEKADLWSVEERKFTLKVAGNDTIIYHCR